MMTDPGQKSATTNHPRLAHQNRSTGHCRRSSGGHTHRRCLCARFAGILGYPTLKHFPGQQKEPADTHHFSADLAIPPATLMHSDWLQFREIAANSRAWIMVAHVRLATVNPIEPASMSRPVIDQLLRKELSLHNPLVTDYLTKGAAYNRGICRSVTAAYSTSMDYLLISFDTGKYVDAVQCLMQSQAFVLGKI